MKDQYVGDINDFRKFGLLRALVEVSHLQLRVVWLWTPPDNREDGNRRQYVWRRRFRHVDRDLFPLMRQFNDEQNRSVDFVPQSAVLPKGTTYFRLKREHEAHPIGNGSLVFFDPDNGLEIANPRLVNKYVYCESLSAGLAAGASVIFYQHKPRFLCNREIDHFINTKLQRLQNVILANNVILFKAKNAFYFLIVNKSHNQSLNIERIQAALQNNRRNWIGRNEIEIIQPHPAD